MSERYALVDETGQVADVVLWDGLADWTAPTGLTALPATTEAAPGWRHVEGEWLAPEAA